MQSQFYNDILSQAHSPYRRASPTTTPAADILDNLFLQLSHLPSRCDKPSLQPRGLGLSYFFELGQDLWWAFESVSDEHLVDILN